MLNDTGYYLRVLRVLLLPNGITVRPNLEKYRIPYVIIFVCFTSMGLCGIIAALFIPNASKMEVMETMYALNACLNTIDIFLVQQMMRKKVLDIYANIHSHYTTDDYFAEICNREVTKMKNIQRIFICIYIFFSVPPLIIISFTDVSIEDIRALNFPMVLPWRTNTMWKYLITEGIELVATTIATTLYFTGVSIVYCFLVAVRSYYASFEKDLDLCFMESEKVRERFTAVIQKHQHLMKFIAKIVNISSSTVKVITLVFGVSCVILISIILQAPDEYLYNLRLISGSVNLVLIFYWCCSIGDELSNLTNKIAEKIYETEWYNQDVQIQKIVLIFMIQNRRQFRLKIFNIYWITLTFFQSSVKNCYTIINLLKA